VRRIQLWAERGGGGLTLTCIVQDSGSRCRDTTPFKMASSIGHYSNCGCQSSLFLLTTICFSFGSFRFVSGLNPLSDFSLPSEAT
jgi:hypothetical protein